MDLLSEVSRRGAHRDRPLGVCGWVVGLSQTKIVPRSLLDPIRRCLHRGMEPDTSTRGDKFVPSFTYGETRKGFVVRCTSTLRFGAPMGLERLLRAYALTPQAVSTLNLVLGFVPRSAENYRIPSSVFRIPHTVFRRPYSVFRERRTTEYGRRYTVVITTSPL